jgi:hypothetical protein
VPRRSAKNDQQDGQEIGILMLPPPKTSHKHEHREDPYESPPGAVPHVVSSAPLKRKLTAAEKKQQSELRAEHKMLATRHAAYLDALGENGGDRVKALSHVLGISEDDVRPQLLDLLAEVRRGLAVSPLGELLERNGLDLAARVNILRGHAYSDNPAASLKAVDLVQEMQGQTSDTGSFENYLRLAKISKG